MNLVEELRKVANPSNHGCFLCDTAYNLGADDNGGCNTCMNTMNQIADLIEKYYFQKPRFEDGEVVRFDDEFVDAIGEIDIVECISFDRYGYNLYGENGCAVYQWDASVKRPVREVYDANNVIINVGDIVWFDNSPNDTKFRVQEIADRVRIIAPNDFTGIGQFVDGDKLTHIHPVLDFDGVPIKVGDTVYGIKRPIEYVVSKVVPNDDNSYVYFENGEWEFSYFLTHRKPDTQEDIYADIIEQYRDGVCPQEPPFTRDKCRDLCTCNSCLAERIMETCDRQRELDSRQ